MPGDLRRRAILAAAGLMACGPPPSGPPPSSPLPATPLPSNPGVLLGPAPATVVLRAHLGKLRDREIADVLPLSPGRLVMTGDAVSFDLDMDRDAYVYVMYVNAQSQIHDLFPDRGHTILRRGHQRLPPYGDWWIMDDKRGPERFLVIASTTRLELPARRSLARKPAPSRPPRRRQSGPMPTPAPDPPPCSDPDDPMACQVTRGDPLEVVAEPSPDGTAVIDFPVDHR